MWILIPAYEPADRLPELIRALAAADPSLRLLVVDDGSGVAYDGVFARAAAAGAEVLHHDANRGKGAALKTGLARVAREDPGTGVVTADADGQHTVHDILAVAEAIRSGDAADGRTMVLGCRAFDGEVPLRSRFGNDVSRWLFRAAAGWRLSDTQTGLRGIPAAMIPWLLEVPGDRFEYEQRVLLRLRRDGFEAREIAIDTVYLEGNESSHFRPVLDSVRVMLPVLVFAASSLLGFLIDTVALFVLNALTGALVPSVIAARLLSASVNFATNRRLVFLRRGRAGMWRDAVKYALLAGILLVSNIVWLSYLTEHGVPLWLAKLVTELVLFFTSYQAQRTVVFGIEYRDRGTASADTSTPSESKARQTQRPHSFGRWSGSSQTARTHS